MLEDYDIIKWVKLADSDSQRVFREAVHTILAAIANDPLLQASMVIKGGILLAVRYHSHRYTKDIDFSSEKTLADINPDEIADHLNQSLLQTAETLEYNLDCRVQSHKLKPTNKPDATFPAMQIKIGYAHKGTPQHKRLLALSATDTITIDYNLNEKMPNLEKISVGEEEITAYALTDLIAEKFRSLIQQPVRDRIRRQDAFDIHMLIGKYPDIDPFEKEKILQSLLEKAHSRDLNPNQKSLRNPDVKKRSAQDYPTLANEISGKLPDFETVYGTVTEFYESLPWDQ